MIHHQELRCIQIGTTLVQGEPLACNTGEPFRKPIPEWANGRLVDIRDGAQVYTGRLVPQIRRNT